ncbi:MAG: glycosyltransferase [Rhizobiaceae bacterium]|nr:glycosyltransferase [Rhizobiaceae bacterium]
MNNTPRVSIVIPTYNSARWLAEAVDSALAQTETDIEVLVFDNASTDDTASVMARYDDPRLSYVRCGENVGFAGNMTRGIRAARGDYFMQLGSDDVLDPRFVATAAALLDRDRSAAMVHGRAVWINDDGTPIGRMEARWPTRSDSQDAFVRTFTEGFCYSTVFSRTQPVKLLGAMDERWGMISDTWLFLKLCLAGDVLFIDEPLVRYRVRESSLSFELYADGKMFDDHLSGLDEAFGWPEARAFGHRKGEARSAVACQAFDTLHMTRLGAGLGRTIAKAMQVVRSEPRVLRRPAAWLRFAAAMMPPAIIRQLRARRRRAAVAQFAEPVGP